APGTDYKITNTDFGRDVCMELAQACKQAGMRLGFYYSPPDMHHPGYRDTSKPATKNWLGEPDRKEWSEYLDYMESHIRKLLTDYGDISVLWFDGLCNHAKYDTQRFHKLIHELSPDTLINDRLGDGYDYVTPEQFIPTIGIPVKSGKPPSGDGIESEKFFRTVLTLFKIPVIRSWIRKQMHRYAEGTLDLAPMNQTNYPSPSDYQQWETCMTIGQTWAFNPSETKWKSPGLLVRNLSTVTGHGGNYLLNVGPTDLGVFPPEAIERLEHIGKWMKTNSKAVYDTSYTPFNSSEWGTATHDRDKIYLHVLAWPENRKLVVENFLKKAIHISLPDGTELDFAQDDSKLEIFIPKNAPDDDVSIITVQIDSDKGSLGEYTIPQTKGKPLNQYIKFNAITSALINGVVNGLIALFSYRLETLIPAIDAGIDVLITVAIITFLTSWLVTGGTRKDIDKEKVALPNRLKEKSKKPMNSALKALLVTLVCTFLFGGVLFGLVQLVFPSGFSNWGYIVFKTLYTAATGALAVVVTIKSVVREKSRKE
ncbi:MAG: alpha-L-fucosidase, partial [Clostridiales bacterium]|nr:alpha-L-fucosidase [Clostridiales bacterium]